MAQVSYTELRGNLASYMEQVCDSRAPLHVTRQNARGVVILSEEEFDGIMETLHLMRSPANASRLMTSIAEADDGRVAPHDLIEPQG